MKISKPIIFNKMDIWLFIYLFVAFVFLITIGIRAVKGEIDFQYYADSETYIGMMEENFSFLEVILLNSNLLGPFIILTVFSQSFLAIFIFHVGIISFFYFRLSKIYNLNKKVLLVLMVISPILFSSIIVVNKEILSILSVTFFFSFYKNKNILDIIFALFISFLVRWQMTLFIISLLVLLSPINIFRNRKILTLSLFLVAVSLLYYFNIDKFEAINNVVEMSEKLGTDTEGSGIFTKLINIQNSIPFGYVIVVLPKFIYLYIGLLARYYNFFDFQNIYINVIEFLQCLINLVIIVWIFKRRISLDNIFLFSAVVYSIIFALSNIYSPRYFFLVYILLTLSLSCKKDNTRISLVL